MEISHAAEGRPQQLCPDFLLSIVGGYNPAGQATFDGMMWGTGAFSMQPGTFAMNSSGYITMGGMGMGGGMTNPMIVQTYSGFMNPAKDIIAATYTGGNGGYQLGIAMK